MSRITREQVERIAELSRLSLSDAEAAAMERDLARILDYVAALQDLDTEGVEPTSHPIALPTPMRADAAVPAMDPERAMANAPARVGTAFVVPKVIDEEGS